jgi:arylsulfatase A-like enzyme
MNTSFYEEIAAIPFMIRYPKLIEPSVSDMHVSLVDIKPTILNFTKTPYNEKVSGVDLIPFITGEKDKSLGRKYSFSQRITPDKNGRRNINKTSKGSFMIRGDRFKLIIYPDGERFFYDLKNDPSEMKNIIDNKLYKNQILEIETELQKWLDETNWRGQKVNYKYLQ